MAVGLNDLGQKRKKLRSSVVTPEVTDNHREEIDKAKRVNSLTQEKRPLRPWSMTDGQQRGADFVSEGPVQERAARAVARAKKIVSENEEMVKSLMERRVVSGSLSEEQKEGHFGDFKEDVFMPLHFLWPSKQEEEVTKRFSSRYDRLKVRLKSYLLKQ